jgi:hypothetical protein
MPATGLKQALLLASALLLCADTTQDIIDLFGKMASALSEGAPDIFLRAIDPAAPNYAVLARNVAALVNQNELSCSIEILKQEADGAAQVVELGWLLDIRGKAGNQISQRREATVKCRLERRNNRWRVVSMEPASFFEPPR